MRRLRAARKRHTPSAKPLPALAAFAARPLALLVSHGPAQLPSDKGFVSLRIVLSGVRGKHMRAARRALLQRPVAGCPHLQLAAQPRQPLQAARRNGRNVCVESNSYGTPGWQARKRFVKGIAPLRERAHASQEMMSDADVQTPNR